MNSISSGVSSRSSSERYHSAVEQPLSSTNLGHGNQLTPETNGNVKRKGRSTGFGIFNRRKNNHAAESHLELEVIGVRRYRYADLYRAIRSVNRSWIIGKGGSASVYKGLLNGGREVAIKLLPQEVPTEFEVSQFVTELKILSRLRHRNLVELLGWCDEANHLALVYEFLPNGSLYDHLRPPSGNQSVQSIPWNVRYRRIAVGLASALLYLQEELDTCVVHRDIKPSNILLDSKFNAKLADFGISRMYESDEREQEITTTVIAGTIGYLDPTFLYTCKFSKETDIYAFRIVALQIASGRRPLDFDSDDSGRESLPMWVQSLHEKGAILEAADPRLEGAFEVPEMERLLQVGLWCSHRDPKSRPSIKLILQLLNLSAPMPANFTSDVFCHSKNHGNISLQSMIEKKGMMPRYLADKEDYEAIRFDLPATSFTPSESTEVSSNNMDVETRVSESGSKTFPAEDVREDKKRVDESLLSHGFQDDHAEDREDENNVSLPRAPRNEHHRSILNELMDNLHKMLQCADKQPQMEEVLCSIKRYTSFLISELGPTLDDWTEIAQLVLSSLKEREDLLKSCSHPEAFAFATEILASLWTEIQNCVRTIYEDDAEFKTAVEKLACAQHERDLLTAKLTEAKDVCHSMEEKVKIIEARRAQNRASLEHKRKQYDVSKQFEFVLSNLSLFAREE